MGKCRPFGSQRDRSNYCGREKPSSDMDLGVVMYHVWATVPKGRYLRPHVNAKHHRGTKTRLRTQTTTMMEGDWARFRCGRTTRTITMLFVAPSAEWAPPEKARRSKIGSCSAQIRTGRWRALCVPALAPAGASYLHCARSICSCGEAGRGRP
jgi:hypothetical protein